MAIEMISSSDHPGEWIPENARIRSSVFRCSLCSGIAYYMQGIRSKDQNKHCLYRYCPHCGHEMKPYTE